MIFLTRRATFSASHYYWNDSWPAEKNERVFGRCANRNGHGHNYTLEVTVAGEPDPVTGFVVDLKWLKDAMEREVLAAYDHKHLNLDAPEFKHDNSDDGEHRHRCLDAIGARRERSRGRTTQSHSGLRDAGDLRRVQR